MNHAGYACNNKDVYTVLSELVNDIDQSVAEIFRTTSCLSTFYMFVFHIAKLMLTAKIYNRLSYKNLEKFTLPLEWLCFRAVCNLIVFEIAKVHPVVSRHCVLILTVIYDLTLLTA